VKKGWIAMGTAFVLLAAACSGGSTALTVAASTTAAPPAASATAAPDTADPPATTPSTTIAPATTDPPATTAVTIPPPDPTDITNYVAASGSVPALSQPDGCIGAAGVCLFQSIKPVVDRLGPENQRYGEPSADYRTWVRPGLALTTRNDETGSITRVTVSVDDGTVVAASDGALVGSTTIGEMRLSDVFPTECYSGFEGQVFLFYTYPGNDDGSAIVSFGQSFRVGDSSAPQNYGPELDAITIRFFEASTTGSICEVSPP